MGIVDTACVSEKVGLDRQIDKLLERNIGYLVADAGYTDLNRTIGKTRTVATDAGNRCQKG